MQVDRIIKDAINKYLESHYSFNIDLCAVGISRGLVEDDIIARFSSNIEDIKYYLENTDVHLIASGDIFEKLSEYLAKSKNDINEDIDDLDEIKIILDERFFLGIYT